VHPSPPLPLLHFATLPARFLRSCQEGTPFFSLPTTKEQRWVSPVIFVPHLSPYGFFRMSDPGPAACQEIREDFLLVSTYFLWSARRGHALFLPDEGDSNMVSFFPTDTSNYFFPPFPFGLLLLSIPLLWRPFPFFFSSLVDPPVGGETFL